MSEYILRLAIMRIYKVLQHHHSSSIMYSCRINLDQIFLIIVFLTNSKQYSILMNNAILNGIDFFS